jgi:hypothetical protein
MDGDERVRFCRECNRNVFNLSEMTEREARTIVREREGRLCVRFYQRRDGTVLTSDCPVGAKRSFLRAAAGTALSVFGLAAGITKLSACGSAQGDVAPPGEPMMGTPPPIETEANMGEIAIPPDGALMGRIAAPSEDD